MIIYLGEQLPEPSSVLTRRKADHSYISLFGLTPDGVYLAFQLPETR